MTLDNKKYSLASLEIMGSGIATSDRIAAMLENAQMLRDFEWVQIKALSAYIQLYRAAPGAVLFREGERGDFMCIVLEGKLEVRKENNLHVDKTISAVLPGGSLGGKTIVEGGGRAATAGGIGTSTP